MDSQFSPQDVSNLSDSIHHQQLTPLSSLSHRQLQPPLYPVPQTLPPLHNRHTTLSIPNGPFDLSANALHSPQTAHIPGSAGHNGSFAHITPYSSMGGSSTIPAFMQPGTVFPNSPTYMASMSGTQPYPQVIAAAPFQGRLPDLRPMPTGGLTQPPSFLSQCTQPQVLSQQPSGGDRETPPTHVVGSQGRRGILPSAPGRAAALEGSSTSNNKSGTVPTKDADGKFPCPYCSKTYLHAKHLKRHLLRHTGDRPYMCVLCKDTFSRSDILKRHFQKCSLRRGNPTGASHLSHSHAYQKKSNQGLPKAFDTDGENPGYPDSLYEPFDDRSLSTATGVRPTDPTSLTARPPKYSVEQQPLQDPMSSSNSVKRRSSGGGRDRRSLTGPGPSGSSRASFDNGLSHMSAVTLPSEPNQIPAASSSARIPHSSQYMQNLAFEQPGADDVFHQNINKEPESLSYGRGGPAQLDATNGGLGAELDWAHLLHPEASHAYINPMFQVNLGQGQLPLKSDPELVNPSFQTVMDTQHEGLFNGIYQTPASIGTDGVLGGGPAWNLDLSQNDPLKSKADQLIAFCLSEGQDQTGDDYKGSQDVKETLTADNVKHFVELFTNFQGHWPLVHMPTFNFLEAYDGLVLVIICIGAVYSDRISVPQVRQLMELAKAAVDRTSHIFATIDEDGINGTTGPLDTTPFELERIQALTMLQILFTWHGNQLQRESARYDFVKFARLARKAALLQPVGLGGSAYSALHQLGPTSEQEGSDVFDWLAWVEQEKRSRLMFIFFLLDAAQVIYFNCSPQFDPFEIRLPLPADDAAWDARTASECANALGLHGAAAQAKNITGSCRRKQPEMHQAMKALMHPTYNLQPRTTNVYSKFILVHGLHVQIWNVQRQLSLGNSILGLNEFGVLGSGTNTPISQNDWVAAEGGSGPTSNSNSGQATPNHSSGMQSPGTHQLLKATTDALQKWKRTWDEDMTSQYPPSAATYRRFGFCRDGVHFYWLARAFLRNNRAIDWQAPPDSRFVQVMNLLKKVRTWVASDNAQRGEEIGSVGDIDESYGVEDLTLDMKLLFKPIDQQIDSPVSGLQTVIDGQLL
ncbi:MAG: hypothetical protein M1830_005836 [Pleopsidium flavum]|nr:MAG: hypothetical protein M1830_005836 [Pleopsidium flavum]